MKLLVDQARSGNRERSSGVLCRRNAHCTVTYVHEATHTRRKRGEEQYGQHCDRWDHLLITHCN
jgi:hypothetical protein